jgi:DNA-nicking Smr family endonuclease
MSDKKKNEKSPFAGALADKLKDLDVDTSAKKKPQAEDESPPAEAPREFQRTDWQKDKLEAEPEAEQPELSDEELFRQAFRNVDQEAIDQAHRTPRKAPGPPSRESDQAGQAPPSVDERGPVDEHEPPEQDTPSRQLSERELFERAVEGLDPADVYSGKFHGEGPELPPEPEESEESEEPEEDAPAVGGAPSEDEAREAVAQKREIRQFEKAVGPVDKKNVRRRKYRQPNRPAPEDHVRQVASYRSDSPSDMITPPLPKTGEGLNNVGGLMPAQKDMLGRYKKRSRRNEVPEINVRGDTVDDALRQIELFVHQQWKQNAHFVRIIHGRGLQSDGDPVLKPAVLRWLEGPGYRYIKGYVPEVNSAGDYGSVVAELRVTKGD